jgi:hypothetical protein
MYGKSVPPKREKSMTTMAATDTQKYIRDSLEDIAGHRRPGEGLLEMLRRIAPDADQPYWRVKKWWYGEVSGVDWHEVENLRIRADYVVERRQKLAAAKSDLERTKDYGAHVARRISNRRRARMDRQSDDRDSRYVFWLGRQDRDLD